MPKRQKESKLLPGEGRPSGGLNLGDFLVTPPAQQRPGQATQAPASSASEEAFPSLGGLSISSKPPVSHVGVWGQSKDSLPSSVQSASSSTAAAATPSSSSSSTSSVPTAAAASSSKPELPFHIAKTKKGSLPIRLENRNKGKKVTVIFNVSGDARELLKELKHAAGCGGVIREDTVELQGDRVDLLEKFLKNKLKLGKNS